MKFDLSGVSVCICMPTNRALPVETAMSLIKTQEVFLRRGIAYTIIIPYGGSVVTAARSKAAAEFMATNASRLFWIDSDMVWEPDGFMRLLALSTRLDCVMAAYRIKKDPPLFVVSGGEVETNELGCLPDVGTGLGFCCVQRKVIEALSERAPKLEFPDTEKPIPHIFREGVRNGAFLGEDMAFFDDIRALGYSVNLDPSIELGHVGEKTFRGKLIDHLEEIKDGCRQ